MRNIIIIALMLCWVTSCIAQDSYPTPPSSSKRLFYIQHSDNTNTYVYDAQTKGKQLDNDDPVEAYRILYAEGGETKPLSTIQKKFAYGIKTDYIKDNFFEAHLAASRDITFYICMKHDQPKIYAYINQHKMYIDRMFIKIKEGTSGLHTKYEYVQFEGTDYESGKPVIEKRYP